MSPSTKTCWAWPLFATTISFFLSISKASTDDPSNVSPLSSLRHFQFHKINFPPWSSLPKTRDTFNKLHNAERRYENTIQGPESIAFDPQGRGPYTSVADGRVIFWDGYSWSDFAYTSANRSEICKPSTTPTGNVAHENICGRPLGLRFDKRTGDLYIADAYFGIMKVGPEGGLGTSIVSKVNGVPLNFANDLDIDSQGVIYFTDSSALYTRKNFVLILFSGDPSGRVLKYDPTTKQTTVILSNMQFPNGLSLSKDESFFVVCESSVGRLIRYWLKGPKAGTSDTFALLPGHPDNIRRNEKGEFWVALNSRRSVYAHIMGLHPTLRKASLRQPIPAYEQLLAYCGGRVHGVIVKYSEIGELIEILEDKDGNVVNSASEVEEKDGQLWIGSVTNSFIAVY